MQYRPHIDGLRAIAVTAVVMFHAFPAAVPGGFVGVDVFFVISGFLISGIIFDEVRENFYPRPLLRSPRPSNFPGPGRCRRRDDRRILVCPPAGRVRALRKAGGCKLTVRGQFLLWLQSGYFSPDANSFPLLHLWSLGVEEQFYIAWPLLVLLFATPRRWLAAILLIGGASFVLSILLAGHRELDFYLPVTRAWELMAGAVMAWLDRRKPAAKRIPVPDFLAVAGLALVAASALMLDPKAEFPSWRAAFPVGGAVLVVMAGGQSRLALAALSSRPVVFTGLISYPLYLWHWPILVLAASVKFMPLTLIERGMAVGTAYALAAVTFRFIEAPIRAKLPTRGQIAALTSCLAVSGIAGAVIVKADGFPRRFPPEVLTVQPERPTAWRVNECLLDLGTQTSFAKGCVERGRPLVLVWGDSTAGALMPGLRELQARRTFGLAQLTASSCQPLLSSAVSPVCRANNQRVLELIADARPDVVLLAGFGPLDETTKEGWAATLTALNEVPRVVVIGPVPLWKRGLPEQSLSYYITHREPLPVRSRSQVYNLWDDSAARSFFAEHGAKYVSTWERFCNPDGCLTRMDEHTLSAIDGVHLTEKASAFLVESIADKVLR